jgi:ABC-type phosphate/phosphonate transport system substrate-binding protein
MTSFIAALPMYDWPECHAAVDAEWAVIRDVLRLAGIAAPVRLTRRNADMPAVPGGIRDVRNAPIAADPSTLPPDGLDLHTLWRHPALLFGQTCWGPMEQGLRDHVRVLGQPDYSDCVGGNGVFYSSPILMRRKARPGPAVTEGQSVPRIDGRATIPVDLMRGARLAYNSADSMSGIIALARDLEALGESLDLFGARIVTGSHRASVVAVAEGRADICAVDCRTWQLMKRFEPKASAVAIVGWTARRPGLPYIAARAIPEEVAARMRQALLEHGLMLPALPMAQSAISRASSG